MSLLDENAHCQHRPYAAGKSVLMVRYTKNIPKDTNTDSGDKDLKGVRVSSSRGDRPRGYTFSSLRRKSVTFSFLVLAFSRASAFPKLPEEFTGKLNQEIAMQVESI